MQSKGFQNGDGGDDDAQDDRQKCWSRFVHELAARMNSGYWTDAAKRKCDAISEFYAEVR
jgi:hypothetical protein